MSRSLGGSSKTIGNGVEAGEIQRWPLENVTDSEAHWYDAITTGLLEHVDGELHLVGMCLVESGTPVEIKATVVVQSNGDGDTHGRWYIKQDAHERLLDAAGVYLLTIYAPRPDRPIIARKIVPATVLDDCLDDRWYDVDIDGRTEDRVCKLAWPHVFSEEEVGHATR